MSRVGESRVTRERRQIAILDSWFTASSLEKMRFERGLKREKEISYTREAARERPHGKVVACNETYVPGAH
jgi:hypothetical protein